MGLMDLFGKKKPVASEAPTAVEYVDWLLQHMLNTSQLTLAIDTRRTLPDSSKLAAGEAPPPCMPDAAQVVNRLKILAGVNPVRQAKPIEGTFERPRKHLSVIITCRFQDNEEYSTCAIRQVIKGLNV